MRRVLLVVMAAALVLGIEFVVWDPPGESSGYSEFCTADGRLGPTPAGWGWRRNHFNDCAWTLFRAWPSDERAPAEVYAEVSLEPPPDYSPDRDAPDWDVVGWSLVVGSLVGGMMGLWNRQF